MFNKVVLQKLKEKYARLHPLMFQRSCERARSQGDLFDILDTAPKLPAVWCHKESRWVHVDDMFSTRETKTEM